ncbi:MAG: hypothetical protein HY720_05635 [Planctomycetes bacterium]|nr:hypothetical protein [Planctomycetota bacterium]
MARPIMNSSGLAQAPHRPSQASAVTALARPIIPEAREKKRYEEAISLLARAVARLRIDGILRWHRAIHDRFARAVVQVVKIHSGLKIDVREAPQSGRLDVSVHGKSVRSFHVSSRYLDLPRVLLALARESRVEGFWALWFHRAESRTLGTEDSRSRRPDGEPRLPRLPRRRRGRDALARGPRISSPLDGRREQPLRGSRARLNRPGVRESWRGS